MLQCPEAPVDYIATSSLISLSSMIGSRIRVSAEPGWHLCPNLWGIIIGNPGTNKSSLAERPVKIVRAIEKQFLEQFEREMKDYNRQMDEIKEIKKRNKEADVTEPEKPVAKRMLTNNATVAAMARILSKKGDGVLLFRDEILGFLNTMSTDYQADGPQFYLECWGGGNSHTVDRVDRTYFIENATLSIVGGIQPEPFAGMCKACRESGNDGMINRFLLTTWPDYVEKSGKRKQQLSRDLERKAFDCFARLKSVEPLDVGAVQDDGSDTYYVPFDKEADKVVGKWLEFIAQRCNEEENKNDSDTFVIAQLSKFKSVVPSLALIIQLADHNEGPVCLNSLYKAIHISTYYEQHFRRWLVGAESFGDNSENARCHRIARAILDGELDNEFTVSDIHRKRYKILKVADDIRLALEQLIDYGWLTSFEGHTGKSNAGRTTTVYSVSPRVSELSSYLLNYQCSKRDIKKFFGSEFHPGTPEVDRYDKNFSQWQAKKMDNYEPAFEEFAPAEDYI